MKIKIMAVCDRDDMIAYMRARLKKYNQKRVIGKIFGVRIVEDEKLPGDIWYVRYDKKERRQGR